MHYVPVSLHEDSWAQILVRIPPVAGAGGGATGTQDTLVQAVLGEREGGRGIQAGKQ